MAGECLILRVPRIPRVDPLTLFVHLEIHQSQERGHFYQFRFRVCAIFLPYNRTFFCCCCGIIHRTSSPGGMYGQSFNKFLMNMAQSECQKQKIYILLFSPTQTSTSSHMLSALAIGGKGRRVIHGCVYIFSGGPKSECALGEC